MAKHTAPAPPLDAEYAAQSLNVPITCTDCAPALVARPDAAMAAITAKAARRAVMEPRAIGATPWPANSAGPARVPLWARLVDGVHGRRHPGQRIGIGGLGAARRGAVHHQLGALLQRRHEPRLGVH